MRTSLLWFISMALAASLPVLTQADSNEPVTPAKPPCQAPTSNGDQRDISCSLTASGTPQRFRFTVSFSGGHDDTMASMVLTLDGNPVACDADSKLSLMGEDGEVTLHCGFAMQARAGTQQVFNAKVRWSHAQYTDFNFEPIG